MPTHTHTPTTITLTKIHEEEEEKHLRYKPQRVWHLYPPPFQHNTATFEMGLLKTNKSFFFQIIPKKPQAGAFLPQIILVKPLKNL